MITVNLIDEQSIFTQSIEVDEKGPQPVNAVYEPVPSLTGDQVAFWNGLQWVVLDQRPVVEPTVMAPVVPAKVRRFQAIVALYKAGYLDSVTAFVNSPDADPILKLAWENALEFERHSSFIDMMATKLSLTDAQIDELFIAADAVN